MHRRFSPRQLILIVFAYFTVSGCSLHIATSDTFEITTVDANTGNRVPYVALIQNAYVTKGSGSFMIPNRSFEEGETRVIFTDKNGKAKAEAIPISGLKGFTLSGTRSYSQSIRYGFSSDYELSYTDTNNIINNDLLLNNNSNHKKIIVMKKLELIKSNERNIVSHFFLRIKRGEVKIQDDQLILFCRFIKSLKENSGYNFDKMGTIKNKHDSQDSQIFFDYLSKCNVYS